MNDKNCLTVKLDARLRVVAVATLLTRGGQHGILQIQAEATHAKALDFHASVV